MGRYTSLALETSGASHISYYDILNKNLKYTTNESGAWVDSIVDDAGDVGAMRPSPWTVPTNFISVILTFSPPI